jgi:HK97 family phage portal protein
MGFLDRALQVRAASMSGGSPSNPAWWLSRLMGGDSTSSGIRVNDDVAMRFSAVYSGCRIYAQDVGTMPFPVFRTMGDKSVKDRQHPAHRVLNMAGNPEMTAAGVRGTLQGHAALRGNAFAEIEWDQAMRIRAMWPLRPDKMRLVRNGRDADIAGAPAGQLAYRYTLPSGQEKTFAPENIFHLRGYSWDGLWGWSIVRQAREGIAVALAAQEYLGRFYANDGRPGLILKHPGPLGDVARGHLKDDWGESHVGLSNAHRVAVLEEGMDIADVPMTFDDAQFLEQRKFEITEIARWFRLPPHLLADLDRSTNNNIEHQGLEYVKFSIRPWCVAWEQELAMKGVVRDPWSAEHNMEGLMRGDAASRAAFYRELRAAGGITPRIIADKENIDLGDDPALDQVLIPLNSVMASAFDGNGMTYQQRIESVSVLVRAGFEPDAAASALGLPSIAHTGLVPTTVTIDPEKLPAKTEAKP